MYSLFNSYPDIHKLILFGKQNDKNITLESIRDYQKNLNEKKIHDKIFESYSKISNLCKIYLGGYILNEDLEENELSSQENYFHEFTLDLSSSNWLDNLIMIVDTTDIKCLNGESINEFNREQLIEHGTLSNSNSSCLFFKCPVSNKNPILSKNYQVPKQFTLHKNNHMESWLTSILKEIKNILLNICLEITMTNSDIVNLLTNGQIVNLVRSKFIELINNQTYYNDDCSFNLSSFLENYCQDKNAWKENLVNSMTISIFEPFRFVLLFSKTPFINYVKIFEALNKNLKSNILDKDSILSFYQELFLEFFRIYIDSINYKDITSKLLFNTEELIEKMFLELPNIYNVTINRMMKIQISSSMFHHVLGNDPNDKNLDFCRNLLESKVPFYYEDIKGDIMIDLEDLFKKKQYLSLNLNRFSKSEVEKLKSIPEDHLLLLYKNEKSNLKEKFNLKEKYLFDVHGNLHLSNNLVLNIFTNILFNKKENKKYHVIEHKVGKISVLYCYK